MTEEKKEKFVYPPRKEIEEELLKVSNFTKEELAILKIGRLYEAYGDIVRYGKQGVEDRFRSKEWFQDERAKKQE